LGPGTARGRTLWGGGRIALAQRVRSYVTIYNIKTQTTKYTFGVRKVGAQEVTGQPRKSHTVERLDGRGKNITVRRKKGGV